MKKYYVNFFLAGCLLGLTGCGTSEISCSGDAESKLVEDIVLPNIKDRFIMEKMNEKDPAAGMLYLAMKNMAETIGTAKDPNEMKGFKEANAEMEKEFKSYKFTLTDVRTTSKDKELNKVECSAKIAVELPSYNVNYDVTYNAQLGDDKENVYVEVESID